MQRIFTSPHKEQNKFLTQDGIKVREYFIDCFCLDGSGMSFQDFTKDEEQTVSELILWCNNVIKNLELNNLKSVGLDRCKEFIYYKEKVLPVLKKIEQDNFVFIF